MPDTYLEECMFARHECRVITTNGFQMVGVIVHDGGSHIVITVDGKNRMVYKHAISTIEAK